MDAVVWSDYVCPWAYFGRDRTDLLRAMGIGVTALPFELHPETPMLGVDLSPRMRARFESIAGQVGSGQPFAVPSRSPNSRLALVCAEIVRRLAPDAFAALDESLFRAHFVDGLDIGDEEVVARLVVAAVADPDLVWSHRLDGAGWVDEARERAIDAGVTGTPAWLIDGRLLIPGVQPHDLYERLVARLRSRPQPFRS